MGLEEKRSEKDCRAGTDNASVHTGFEGNASWLQGSSLPSECENVSWAPSITGEVGGSKSVSWEDNAVISGYSCG